MISSSRQKCFRFLPAGALAGSTGSSRWEGSGWVRGQVTVSGSDESSIPCPGGTSAAGLVAALLDPCGLSAQFPEVVQLGPADAAPADRLDLVDRGAVHREGALHADAIADLADREGLPGAAALTPDHHALEYLDPRAVTLGDPDVDLQRIPGPEVRDVRPGLGLLDFGDGGMHDSDFLSGGRGRTARRQPARARAPGFRGAPAAA